MQTVTEDYFHERKRQIQNYITEYHHEIRRNNKGFNLGVFLVLDTFVFKNQKRKAAIPVTAATVSNSGTD